MRISIFCTLYLPHNLAPFIIMQDLRIIKTHKAIREAMVTLLHEKPYHEIYVQDILVKALVNRTTFYRHYTGKSDLAGKMIDDFKAQYIPLVRQRSESDNPTDFYRQLLPILAENGRLILALWKIDTPRHHLYRDMHDIIRENSRIVILRRYPDIDMQDLDYQIYIAPTLILENIRYHVERQLPIDLARLLSNLRQMLTVVENKSDAR